MATATQPSLNNYYHIGTSTCYIHIGLQYDSSFHSCGVQVTSMIHNVAVLYVQYDKLYIY